MLNLYLITGNTSGYDVFKNAVVAAKTPEDAKLKHPDGKSHWDGTTYGTRSVDGAWDKPSNLDVQLIGKAEENIQEGVVNHSFNAG